MSELFTSESETEEHPNKAANQISDAILDELIRLDSRVAPETTVATDLALMVGEITTKAYEDISRKVRNTIREIGYAENFEGFDTDSIAILQSIDKQSADIALSVADIAEKAEVEIAYAVGAVKLVSTAVETFGAGNYDNEKIVEAVNKVFDLRTADIVSESDLRRPIYKKAVAYGRFGRDGPDFTWEKLDKVDKIKTVLKA